MLSDTGNDLAVIILAAGKGKRMNSPLPKVLHTLNGKPLLEYAITTAKLLSPIKLIVVVGNGADIVMERFQRSDVVFVIQREQLGTGHAVAQAGPGMESFQGDILILSGDVPMIRKETLGNLISVHRETGNTLTFLTTNLDNPTGYGRVKRKGSGSVEAVIEERDAAPEIKTITEINSGIYCVKSDYLFKALKQVDNNNDQHEYYLTDIVKRACEGGSSVGAVEVPDTNEVMGINTVDELRAMEKVLTSGNIH